MLTGGVHVDRVAAGASNETHARAVEEVGRTVGLAGGTQDEPAGRTGRAHGGGGREREARRLFGGGRVEASHGSRGMLLRALVAARLAAHLTSPDHDESFSNLP